jgi:hypothetical protein
LFTKFKALVRKEGVMRRGDARIVFVCGASQISGKPVPQRAIFMEYARKHLTNFRFFLAEDVFNSIQGVNEDLLTIEGRLGNFSDCIMIFCESESAFAELGAFCLKEELVGQVLVVNDKRFRHSDSFINRGPIARADKRSKFKPVIHGDFEAILMSAETIKERLEQNIPHQRRQRIRFLPASSFSDLEPKDQLLILADFIHLFGPITTTELVAILADVLGIGISSLDTELALGWSLKLFRQIGSPGLGKFWCPPTGEAFSFFSYNFGGFRPTDLRAEIVRHYFKNRRERLSLSVAHLA